MSNVNLRTHRVPNFLITTDILNILQKEIIELLEQPITSKMPASGICSCVETWLQNESLNEVWTEPNIKESMQWIKTIANTHRINWFVSNIFIDRPYELSAQRYQVLRDMNYLIQKQREEINAWKELHPILIQNFEYIICHLEDLLKLPNGAELAPENSVGLCKSILKRLKQLDIFATKEEKDAGCSRDCFLSIINFVKQISHIYNTPITTHFGYITNSANTNRMVPARRALTENVLSSLQAFRAYKEYDPDSVVDRQRIRNSDTPFEHFREYYNRKVAQHYANLESETNISSPRVSEPTKQPIILPFNQMMYIPRIVHSMITELDRISKQPDNSSFGCSFNSYLSGGICNLLYNIFEAHWKEYRRDESMENFDTVMITWVKNIAHANNIHWGEGSFVDIPHSLTPRRRELMLLVKAELERMANMLDHWKSMPPLLSHKLTRGIAIGYLGELKQQEVGSVISNDTSGLCLNLWNKLTEISFFDATEPWVMFHTWIRNLAYINGLEYYGYMYGQENVNSEGIAMNKILTPERLKLVNILRDSLIAYNDMVLFFESLEEDYEELLRMPLKISYPLADEDLAF